MVGRFTEPSPKLRNDYLHPCSLTACNLHDRTYGGMMYRYSVQRYSVQRHSVQRHSMQRHSV